jgi:mono/diheme cytochrome c family protein
MKKLLLISTALALSASITWADNNGEALMKKHCASCHMLQAPTWEMIPTLKVPAMDAVVFHIKNAIENPKEQKAFIVDYVQNPDKSKSVCESNKVQQYGLMPSLKGKVSPAELETIAEYMLEAYPHKAFVALITEVLKNDKMNALRHSPFLINSERLPHFTKLLIQNWDKAKLGLTDEQKQKLLILRKETLSAIKTLKPQIQGLEDDIADEIKDGESPQSIESQLKKLAELKADATRAHLKCIADTIAILNEKQIEFLLPFWE